MTELDPQLEADIEALDNEYTKDELLAYAEQFGVEVKSSDRKAVIARAYAEIGVTVDLIKGVTPPAEEVEDDEEAFDFVQPAAPVVEDDEEEDGDDDFVLVKMTRTNFSYEIRGYKFTRTHPFALVKEDDADYLIEEDGGFRMASPKEARAYYS